MGPIVKRRLRRFGMAGVIAAAPIAILCAYVTNLLVPTEPLPRPVHYEYIPVAVIEETNGKVGIADSDLYGMSQEDVDRHLDAMLSLGVDTVRVLIPWADIQPVEPGALPPDWEESLWARSEYIINAANERGMAVLGVLNTTPGWGVPGGEETPGWHIYQPPDPEKYGEWARTVAERFQGLVSAYEIWNEPNYTGYWVGGPDPETYTDILRAAYQQIKAIDPAALVVAGVVGTVQDSPFTMNPVTFIQRMYDADAKGFFDALSIHPYSNEISFPDGLDPTNPWQTPVEQLIAIRELMIAHGDEALKIWATEYGLSTWIKDEQTQAEWVKEFLDFWSSLDYTGPAFLYTLRDRLNELTEEGTMGIFTYDWARKLVADVVECFNTGRKCAVDPEEPEEPGNPGNPPTDPVTAIVQALTAALQQIYTVVAQTVSGLANAVVTAISDALRNLFGVFSPATAALNLPADTRVVLAFAVAEAAEEVTGEEQVSKDGLPADPAESTTEVTTGVTTDETTEPAEEPTEEAAEEQTAEEPAEEKTEGPAEESAVTEPAETPVATETTDAEAPSQTPVPTSSAPTTEPEITEPVTEPEVTEPEETSAPAEQPDVTEDVTEHEVSSDDDEDSAKKGSESNKGDDDKNDDKDSGTKKDDDKDTGTGTGTNKRVDTRDGNKVTPGTGGAGNGAGAGSPGGGSGGGAGSAGADDADSDAPGGGDDNAGGSGGSDKSSGGSAGGSNVSYIKGPWGMILYV